MTTVINLYAGPGSGKSTTAAKLFSMMKERSFNVELVQEWVKQWAWEKRKPVQLDQFYLFGKQARREYSLFGQVEYIVTDAPVLLTCYYAQVFGTPEQGTLFRSMLLTYLRMCQESGHHHKHIFINRTKAYDPRGRFQDEAGARQIDDDLRRYLKESGISAFEVKGDVNCAQAISDFVLGENK
jgi:hypothetical protein